MPPPQPAPAGRTPSGASSPPRATADDKKGRRAARCRSKRQRRVKSRPGRRSGSCRVVKGGGSAMAAGLAGIERRRGERGGRLLSNRPGGCGTRAAAWQTAQRRGSAAAARGLRRLPVKTCSRQIVFSAEGKVPLPASAGPNETGDAGGAEKSRRLARGRVAERQKCACGGVLWRRGASLRGDEVNPPFRVTREEQLRPWARPGPGRASCPLSHELSKGRCQIQALPPRRDGTGDHHPSLC